MPEPIVVDPKKEIGKSLRDIMVNVRMFQHLRRNCPHWNTGQHGGVEYDCDHKENGTLMCNFMFCKLPHPEVR